MPACPAQVSAFFNPGILLAQAVRGNVGGAVDFFALLAAELVGYFVGAAVLWLFYLPHLNAAVQLPAADEVDRLLLDPSMLRQAGRRRRLVGSCGREQPAYGAAPHAAWLCTLRCRLKAPPPHNACGVRCPPLLTPALPRLSSWHACSHTVLAPTPATTCAPRLSATATPALHLTSYLPPLTLPCTCRRCLMRR